MNDKDKKELLHKREAKEAKESVTQLLRDTGKQLGIVADPPELASIRAHAAVTAKAFLEQQEARAAEERAERSVLKKALQILKPIRTAIMGKIPWEEAWHAGKNDTRISWFHQSAVVLVDRSRTTGVGTRDSDAEGGTYSGNKLLLVEDGKLLRGTLGGSWSRDPDTLSIRTLGMLRLRSVEAIQTFGLVAILKGIETLLISQGGRAGAAERHRERARQLHDIIVGTIDAEPKRLKLVARREEKLAVLVRAAEAEVDGFGGMPDQWDAEGRFLHEALEDFRAADDALSAADRRAKEGENISR